MYTRTMLDWVASVTGARAAHRGERVQSLWSGYGEVIRVHLEGAAQATAIVKHVAPPASARGSVSDERKRRSYGNELAFYRDYAARCTSAPIARHLGSRVTDGQWWIVLEDLDAAGFAERRDDVDERELAACLRWLAAFHATFLGDPGIGLWPIGSYWQLDTRRDELANLRDTGMRAGADDLHARLCNARYQTIVHGDPKPANFCFAHVGGVAAVDFQYAGRGPGIRDVAYLLHGHPDRHVETYFAALRPHVPHAVEAEWRALFPVAKRDFHRFLAGWRGTW